MSDERMKPMIILPPDTVSEADIEKLNENGICVVEASDPSQVRFLDPIPTVSSRDQMEQAAIQLSRCVLNRTVPTASSGYLQYSDLIRLYVDLLVDGTSLSDEPTEAELLAEEQHQAKVNEARRLGREEAKAERNRKKKTQEDAS